MIEKPQDLQHLSEQALLNLAEELRQEILRVVAKNGGHLASNLGVVELALALHLSFDLSKDRLVWDVGHQVYAHKLLTGRQEGFASLRQFGGVSGFPKPTESPFDHYIAGHSSTSISAALGMALARDVQKRKHEVVAVIGDGALTGGMAWEALNHAGDCGSKLIVVLNDNEMSIARNVGALASCLSRARSAPTYRRTKADVEALLRRIPAFGRRLSDTVERVKDSFKYFLVPGMIFEELGFTYLGPVDGHSIGSLRTMLEAARSLQGPVVVHCMTQKGRGYKPAELTPDLYHGIGPFDIRTGKPRGNGKGPSYTDVFGETIVSMAETDERLVAITAAMPDGTGLGKFSKRFPERFYDVGIAEQHAVTLAGGLAAAGLRPVFAVYSTFLQRAYDQIVHDICIPKLPVVFAVDRAGLVGADGETHQGVFDIAFLRHMPNMTILAPRNQAEMAAMLRFSSKVQGPVAIRYPRGEQPKLADSESNAEIVLGKSVCLARGRDVLLINCGTIWDVTTQVAEGLRAAGVEPTIYDARFVKPLDEELLSVAAEHAVAVVLEEGSLQGGFGSALLEGAAERGLDFGNVLLCGVPDYFVPHGTRAQLLERIGLDASSITARVLSKLQEGRDEA